MANEQEVLDLPLTRGQLSTLHDMLETMWEDYVVVYIDDREFFPKGKKGDEEYEVNQKLLQSWADALPGINRKIESVLGEDGPAPLT